MSAKIPHEQIAIFRDNQKDVLKQRLIEQEVCEYWGVIFSPRGIASLRRQDMLGFMSYSQNRRWREISKENVAEDLERLKTTLSHLTDESLPISQRLNNLEPGYGPLAIPHFGRAKISPILLVSQPKKYGVWNDYSERAMKAMEIFPDLSNVNRLGDQYERINNVLVSQAQNYRISLWRLDIILEQIARLIR